MIVVHGCQQVQSRYPNDVVSPQCFGVKESFGVVYFLTIRLHQTQEGHTSCFIHLRFRSRKRFVGIKLCVFPLMTSRCKILCTPEYINTVLFHTKVTTGEYERGILDQLAEG